MANVCFGIFVLHGNEEKCVFDLGKINYWYRSSVRDFLIGTAKELNDRLNIGDRIDILLSKDGFDMFAVGLKNHNGFCLIFTYEKEPHGYLFCLADKILTDGLKETIVENYKYVQSTEKIKQIQSQLDDINTIMIKNIELVLKRGENIDDLVNKSQYLSDQSKGWYIKTKDLNSCCHIL